MALDSVLIWSVAIVGFYKAEMLRSKHLDLLEETKNKIAEEGVWHLTSKQRAEQIVESGYILPTKGITDNHFSKSRYGDGFGNFAYMFAGKPSIDMVTTNSLHMASGDGTIYAVKHTPNQYEINNYTERLSDGAITYEGRLDIANSNPELVRMKVEKGKLIEIPWDEPIKASTWQKIRLMPVIKCLKAIPVMTGEIRRALVFRDKGGRLRQCIARRRQLKQIIQQYNSDTNLKCFEVLKDGVSYEISTIGTKINDGRLLTGFRVSQKNGEFEKNIFMEATDMTNIGEENLKDFLIEHMNEKSVRSEYIGRAVVGENGIEQELDQEYAHHFYQKQLMVVKNDATYAQYIKDENEKKKSQLGRYRQMFETSTLDARKDAMYYLKKAKEIGLKIAKELIENQRGGIVLGG